MNNSNMSKTRLLHALRNANKALGQFNNTWDKIHKSLLQKKKAA